MASLNKPLGNIYVVGKLKFEHFFHVDNWKRLISQFKGPVFHGDIYREYKNKERKKHLSNEKKVPWWLFRVYSGLYYPVM